MRSSGPTPMRPELDFLGRASPPAVSKVEPIKRAWSSGVASYALNTKLRARLLHVSSSVFEDDVQTGEEVTVSAGKLLAPLGPGDVHDFKCVGLNYRKHITEAGRSLPPYPSIFLKPATSFCDYGDSVPIPRICQDGQADYEGELCIVIGRDCRNVSKEQAYEVIAGYTCGDDVSSRKWQRDPKFAGGVPQWCFSKGFDKYAPLGPAIVSTSVIKDPGQLTLQTRVNGDLRQDTPTADLCFDVPTLVSFISQGTTLKAGTIIMTGTPGGVGIVPTNPEKSRPLKEGDTVEIFVSQIGTLRHGISHE